MAAEGLQLLVDISDRLEHAVFDSIINLQDPMMALIVILGCIAYATTFEGYFSASYSVSNLLIKLLQIGFYMWLISRWDMILSVLLESAENLGKIAGGSNSLKSPAGLISDGVDKIFACYAQLVSGFPSSVSDFFAHLLAAVALAIALYGLFKIAFVLFMANAEFLILGGLSIVLLPFAVLRFTESIADKTWGILLTCSMKVMVAVFMVCMVGDSISDAFASLSVAEANEQSISSLLLAACSLVFLSFLMGQAVEFAGAMTSGLSVNTGNIIHAVTPSRGTVMGAGNMVLSAAKRGGGIVLKGAERAGRAASDYAERKIQPWWFRSRSGDTVL